MEKANIGMNAGHVWRRLNGLGLVSVPELARKLRLSDSDTTLAVGWLAREDKIQFYEDKAGHKDYLYLEINYYIG